MTTWVLGLVGSGLYGLVLASRLLCLAPYRAGWVLYLANLVWELGEKRAGVSRFVLEAGAGGLALVLLALAGLPHGVVLFLGLGLLAFELGNRLWERALLTGLNARLDRQGLRSSGREQERFPAPSVHPDLTLTLEGPFVERVPTYRLGVLALREPFELGLIVGNHTRVPTQRGVLAVLEVPAGWMVAAGGHLRFQPMASAEVRRESWLLTPSEAMGPGVLELAVQWDGERRTIRVSYEACRPIDPLEVREVGIQRYPGARRAAFAWRGDMDLYDTSSFQSIEGLTDALALGARYAIAQSMFVSTRLTLDEAAAREWADRYGVDRGAAEIPRFIEWLRQHVELRLANPYPALSNRPYVMELGNHGHLHYDTDTSGAPGNGWKAGARPGDGVYPWMGEDRSSFGDQRDNILEAQRWFERCLGFRPRSWAKPGRGNDAYTPAAVEAAGFEVASGSDIRPFDNALRQPPPHRPNGGALVELTARYPGDPQHVYHLAMLLFWMHRAHRRGMPMLFMCHQHLRQFAGTACARLTERVLRHAVEGFQGDLYIDTVYGVGTYWRDILSEHGAKVTVAWESGRVRVTNRCGRDLVQLPVDIRLDKGERMTRLVSVAGGATLTFDLCRSSGDNI